MPKSSTSSWQIPPQAASESYKLGWLNEHTEDGLAWQRSQRGYGDWQKAFEILSGRVSNLNTVASYRSQLRTARLKRNLKEVRGAVANIRPIWGYATDNKALAKQAEMMNIATQAIYQERFLDLSIKRAIDWAMTTCTAFIHPVYRRDMGGTGQGNLDLDVYGQPCVLPSQLPSDGDYQKAYAVSLMDEIPIYLAHGLFPKFQDRLYPTASKFWYSSEIRTSARGNLFQRMFGTFLRKGDNVLNDLYVPVRKTWVIDLSINETGQDLYLGDWTVSGSNNERVPATSWSYMVPYKGKKLANGRIADENDARIYPNRRLIISSEACVMYDGPAFDLHGRLPLVPLTLDDWAFDPMGYSLVRDGYEIQMSLDELERGTMDKNRAQMDMSLAYDINSVTSREAKEYDPMQPRGRVGYDGSLVTEPFKSVVPENVLRVQPEIFQAIEHLEQTMDYQMGINDITALARARGLMGPDDSVDKLMAANGPIIMDITRNVERTLSEIGQQTKFIIPQFYPAQRIMQYTGPDKMTQQTWDYDPGKLIPSHMPHENAHDDKQNPLPSKYSLIERTKWFCQNLRFSITPHTAHELVQMAHKLGLIQLKKAGIQISSKTIAEAWNIYNFGGPAGNTEYERFFNEQEDIATHAIRIKELVAALQNDTGIEATPAMQRALEILTGQNAKEGRPPTGKASPRIVQKDGGERSTISESGS